VPAQSRLTVKSTYKPIADVVHSSTNLDSKSLQTTVRGVNIMSKVQCNFADGICGSQPLIQNPVD